MAWLRIDDGFAEHPKLIALPDDKTRWAVVRILCYCARYRTDGHVSRSTIRHLGVTSKQIDSLVNARILDADDGEELHVHDWQTYNPKDATAAERMQRHRNGKRNDTVTQPVTDTVTETSPLQPSRAGTRARSRPVPLKRDTSNEASLLPIRPRDEIWDALENELGPVATKSERGKRNNVVKQLRDIGATPAEIRDKCRAYRTRWPGIELTDTALASHWSKVEMALPTGRPLSAGDLFAIADQLGAKEIGA